MIRPCSRGNGDGVNLLPGARSGRSGLARHDLAAYRNCVTEPPQDVDREVIIDSDDDVVVPADIPHDEAVERARRREVENDPRLLEERPPHW